jgi:GIY-YIG catalytic domain
MTASILFRDQALSTLTNKVGCYSLCDLDGVPVYVGKSVDGIRTRVRRHLTSARSDIIANRQIDVWEIAWVWAFSCERHEIDQIEASLFHKYNDGSTLMNGSAPKRTNLLGEVPHPEQTLQIMSFEEIEDRKNPNLRLPRQALQYSSIIGPF